MKRRSGIFVLLSLLAVIVLIAGAFQIGRSSGQATPVATATQPPKVAAGTPLPTVPAAKLPTPPLLLASTAPGHIMTYIGGLSGQYTPTSLGMSPEGVASAGPNLLLINDTGNNVLWLDNLGQQPVTHYGRTVAPGDVVAIAQASSTGIAVNAAGDVYIGVSSIAGAAHNKSTDPLC